MPVLPQILSCAFPCPDRDIETQGLRAMVARLEEPGAEVKDVEVPGGNHGNVVAPNFPAMFDFFDAHRKSTTTGTR